MIHVRNLGFTHPGNIPALRDINLDIHPGECLAIIGPNGSGKTTLARCLNGLHLPQTGQVLVDGLSIHNPQDRFEIRKRIGMVFQNPDDQLVSTTVESEIAFGLENLAIPTAEMHRRVDEALRQFHLETYRHSPPHHLSGGEKQRVAIAAAIALRPRYLVLDEPTALLDPQGRQQVRALLDTLRDDFNIATIHITQFPAEAARAERLIVLHQGCLLDDAPPVRIFQNARQLHEIGLDIPFASAVSAHLQEQKQLPVGFHLTIDKLADALVPQLPPSSPRRPRPAPLPVALPKLSTENLDYIFDAGLPTEHLGLEQVSVAIPAGSIVALLGPSGAGKTTLAQHFNALLRPHRGRVLLEDQDIWAAKKPLPRIRQRVGLVFQFPELQLFEETVDLDVAFGPRNLGLPSAQIEDLVTASLATVGLPREQFGQRSPLSLSGGEKRRAALAGVLAMDPEVLVLDEPTAGLDPRATQNMRAVFRQLQERGTTLVLITHDMDLVAELAGHLIVLRQGRVELQGPARQILTDPDLPLRSGLERPAPVRLMQALAARGYPAPTDLITREEVLEFLDAIHLPTQ